MTRAEYQLRIAEIRPLLAAFRGRLEHSEVGGSNGSISERAPDGKEWHFGGAVTCEGARAIVACVNLVLDLCAPQATVATTESAHDDGAADRSERSAHGRQ